MNTISHLYAIKDLADFEYFINGHQIELLDSTTPSAIYITKNDELNKLYFILDSSIPEYRKMPKLAASRFLQDMKLLEAMANNYIPIINRDTKQLLYTHDEFLTLRKKMSGMKQYNTGDFIFADNLDFLGIENYLQAIDQNFAEINSQRNYIFSTLKSKVSEANLELGAQDDSEIKILDIGSTARGTNIPSFNGTTNFDFDFIMQADESQIDLLRNTLVKSLSKNPADVITSRRIRLKAVKIDGIDKPLDIDISFIPKKEKYLSTEQALAQRLEQIKLQDEEKYRKVLANIMHAKRILKAAHAYKPSRSDKTQGGLGGIGIENWVLQNGGSLEIAAHSFLASADNRSFIEFEKIYPIFDFGKNHMSVAKGTFPYDNFVMKNMRENGYLNMRNCLTNYLYNQLEQPTSGIKL